VPTDKSVGESGDAVTAAEHNKISSVAGTAKEQPSKNEAPSTESKHSEDQNITEAMPPSDVSNDDRLKCDDKNEDRNAAIAYSSESAQANADASNPKRQSMLEFLGRELNCTLAEYQTAFDLSSSKERVEQLEYMNDIVVKTAVTQVGTGVSQYIGYLRDISTPLVPEPRPIQTSYYGER
jgi:hypothetical protein